ncbi:MAG: hypothetical protein ABSG76_13030 [Xanthobacteraceae bacterium]|jgi:broad specificity phosphatase PhoE
MPSSPIRIYLVRHGQSEAEYDHYDKHKRFEGEFFAPMPLGESRVHVADRVKGVFGTILRDASPERSSPIDKTMCP